jgi:hypothetical protein
MQAEDGFSKGMQTIERAIIEGVRAVGRHIIAADFTWHRDRVGPAMTDVEVRLRGRAVVGIFSREEIEDAADHIDRPETVQTIQRIIAEAGQLPR